MKDPDAVLDYRVDWTAWLQASETITTSTWILESGIVQNSTSNTTTTATVWLSGGTAGTAYKVTNRVTTNQGRTDDRTIKVFVTDR
jgi:hypothetical protein